MSKFWNKEFLDEDDEDKIVGISGLDLDALICTVHGIKHSSGEECPLCARARLSSETNEAAVEAHHKQIIELKGEGNDLLAAGDYGGAVETYEEALESTTNWQGYIHSTQDISAAMNLSIALHLNISLAEGKRLRWAESEAAASRVLERSQRHPKALFRRGVARLRQGQHFGKALRDLKLAASLAPKDAAVRKALKEVRSCLDEIKAHEEAVRSINGMEHLKNKIEDVPNDQFNFQTALNDIDAMARQLPNSYLSQKFLDKTEESDVRGTVASSTRT